VGRVVVGGAQSTHTNTGTTMVSGDQSVKARKGVKRDR
jgi:hypothetical protein